MVQFIITPEEMYDAERAVFATGRPSFELMEQAGRAVADLLHQYFPKGAVRVLCGPGGNGGDGLIAAARLLALGRDVSVFLQSPLDALTGDVKLASERWPGKTERLPAALSHPAHITLDALFGGGLSRPLQGVHAQLATEASAPVVSVDVPSGLDGASGRTLGACFDASLTVTFAALRPAHVLSPGKHLCGDVEVVDLQLPVPTHTIYRALTAKDERTATVFADVDACKAAIGEASARPVNSIELVRSLAQRINRPVLLERPDRIMGKPSGRVIVAPRSGGVEQPDV